jgi:hypothetical protein
LISPAVQINGLTGPFKRLLSDLMHHATESPLCAGCSDEKVSVDHARHLHRVRSHRDVDIVVTELGELDYGRDRPCRC